MKNRQQGLENRDLGPESGDEGAGSLGQDLDRVKFLLKNALPSMGDDPDADRDLWPAMLRRMDHENLQTAAKIPWFDWALAGGLVAFAAIVPRTIPVILYYL